MVAELNAETLQITSTNTYCTKIVREIIFYTKKRLYRKTDAISRIPPHRRPLCEYFSHPSIHVGWPAGFSNWGLRYRIIRKISGK